jgi:hypothetical protein
VRAVVSAMDARDPSTVAAISRGSREAFVALFDWTSDAIRAELALHLPNESHAIPVFASTYVEVWWRAGCRPGSATSAYAGAVDEPQPCEDRFHRPSACGAG